MSKTVYILADQMRVSQSPFYGEGTNIQYDIPDEYPLPHETVVVKNGKPMVIRCIPQSQYLEKAKQISEEKWPVDWEPSEADRQLLTFKHGRLEDSGKLMVVTEYLKAVGWNEENEKDRPDNMKTIFVRFDESKLLEEQLSKEDMIFEATKAIYGLSDKQIEELYLLSLPGATLTADTGLSKMKMHLLNTARVAPEFIKNGIKDPRDKMNVLLHKALKYNILTLNMAGFVSIEDEKRPGDWEPLLELNEAGGPEGKFNRFVDFLLTSEGKPSLAVIEKRVANWEEKQMNSL